MNIYKTDYKVLSFRSNAANFINSLSSNSLDKRQNAFLNQHGRIVATVDQFQVGDDEWWVVVASVALKGLMDHLGLYARLNKCVIEEQAVAVYADLDGDCPLQAGDKTVDQAKGRLILTPRSLVANVSGEDFTRFRLVHHIPCQGLDYHAGEMILNVDEFAFVSYTKGCFLGQEPVAKVHNRAKPTWKLVVKYADECNEEEKRKMTSTVLELNTGRLMGFVFVHNQ